MKFSERYGFEKMGQFEQVDSIDTALSNRMWSVIYIFILKEMSEKGYLSGYENARLIRSVWINLFKMPYDELSNLSEIVVRDFKEWYFSAKWYEKYELVEYILNLDCFTRDAESFIKALNYVFIEEMSAYRIVDKKLLRITSEVEVQEIESAIGSTENIKLNGVNEHLKSAYLKLSDRKNPDYRNSIKESISAVESIASIIADQSKAELAKALNTLKEKANIHPALSEGFKKIYGYTSDEDGIRHAILESAKCDYADAKYMLVSCSAFVNYLIQKANDAGIELK